MKQSKIEDVLPLGPLQEGLLFQALYDQDGPDLYTVQSVFHLSGGIDGAALRTAARALQQRHAVLRAGFRHEGGGQPMQVIRREVPVRWAEHDLTGLPAAEQDRELDRIEADDRARRFDMARPPLMRFTLVTLDAGTHRLLVTRHHILMDGWSSPIILRELFELYGNGGDAAALPPVTPYRDYLAWLAKQDRPAAEAAWRTALAGVTEPTLLAPQAAGRDQVVPDDLVAEFPAELSAALTALARAHGWTLNTLVQGAWGLLLSVLTGRDEVIFGTTVSGRPPEIPGVESMVGLFINTLPVRVRLDPAEPLTALFTQLRDQQTELMDHQHLTLTEIQAMPGVGALFDTLVLVENFVVDADAAAASFAGAAVTGGSGRDATHYPLSITFAPGERILLKLSHRPDLFDRRTAESLVAQLEQLFAAIAANPDQLVGRVHTLPPAGRAPVLTQQAFVLDRWLRPVPPGVTGELYLTGADGPADLPADFGRPAPTAARLVACPFGPPGTRMHRTGTAARWSADGDLVQLHRAGARHTVRGAQLDLGEIETVLAGHPDVQDTTVLLRSDQPGERRVVAYLVPVPGSRPDAEEVRAHAAAVLPEHAVPAALVLLDALPRTEFGDLDRAALPAPEAAGQLARAPRTPQEEILCGLFADVLGVERVGVQQDFFDLGGHSLRATRLMSRVRSAFGVELPIRALFEAPTPARLAERLAGAGQARQRLVAGPRPDVLPLSFAQLRLWFLNRVEQDAATYNIPAAIRFTGELDTAALAAALRDVVGRHESLRTVFPEVDGVPRQLVRPSADLDLGVSVVTEPDLPAALAGFAARPFDLAEHTPLRAHLFALGPADHVLLLVTHHIAADGWAMGPLARDLSRAYRARTAGAAPVWTSPPVQYPDYALWQRDVLGDEDDPQSPISRQLAHWRTALADLPAELAMPVDRPRPAEVSGRGGTIEFDLAPRLQDALTALAKERQATLFMVLQAGFATLLSRLGGGPDIPMGTPIAGRTDDALDDLIGCFVNTLVLRTDLSGDPSFADLLGRVREHDLAAYAHQDVPFERLVEVLNPERTLARHPLFQVMITLQNNEGVTVELPGLELRPEPTELGVSMFDLSLEIGERPRTGAAAAGIECALRYNADLFDHDTAQAVADRLVRVFDAVVAAPDRPISEIDLLTPAERTLVLPEWHAPDVPDRTLPELFQAQTARTPAATALVFDGGTLTYAELNARANRLARLLVQRGAGPDRVVAVDLPWSADLVVAVLAVLKAGAICQTATVCPADVLVTTGTPTGTTSTVLLDAPVTVDALTTFDEHDLVSTFPAATAATLTASGAALSHTALALPSNDNSLSTTDRVLPGSSTVDELLRPLVRGAALVLPDADLAELLTTRGVTVAHLAPAALRDPALAAATALRQVHCRGELVSADLRARFGALSDAELHTDYAPAGTAPDTLRREPDAGAAVRIGRPADGTAARVLDAALRPVPVGVPGELYLAGARLASGYRNRPGRTAVRFVPDPFGPPGSRMHRTGDLARWRRDGTLELTGRPDGRTDHGGLRVDPAEVEAVLARHEQVHRAAVCVREDEPGDRQLVAYLHLASAGHTPDDAALRAHLAVELPAHAVPSVFVVLPALPLHPDGEVDRAALPAPGASAAGRAPRSAREEVLCGLFAELLGVPEVSIDDNFFELGGHSLQMVKLASRVRKEFGVDITLRTILDTPTVAGLADRLYDQDAQDGLDVLLPIQAHGSRTPVFCVHPGTGVGWPYSRLIPEIGQDRPIYTLQAQGLRDVGDLPGSIEHVLDTYLGHIRAVQPDGPYCLLGWSLGGALAQLLAARLQAQGAQVALLCSVDGYPLRETTADVRDFDQQRFLREVAEVVGIDVPADQQLDRDEVLTAVRGAGSPFATLTTQQAENMFRVHANFAAICRDLVPEQFHGDLLFFQAADSRAELSPQLWQEYLDGQLEVHELDCGHGEVMQPEAMAVLGPVLREKLRSVP